MTVHQRGFTLLEIMVVIVLIALTVTMIGLNLDRDIDQIANLEAQRFAKLLEHVRDESILSGKTYAVDVDEHGRTYNFLESAGEWVPVARDDVLRRRSFPEFLTVRFEILGARDRDAASLLVIQVSGEITPFELTVLGDKYDHVVSVDDTQNILVNQVGRDAG